MDEKQWAKIDASITAQAKLVEVVDDIRDKVTDLHTKDAVLEERVDNHKQEVNRRFQSTHKRIDDVVADARKQGAIAGAPIGVIAIIWASIKDSFFGGS